MKNILCVLVLTCVVMGAAFAQAKPAAPAQPAPTQPAQKPVAPAQPAPAPAPAAPAEAEKTNAFALDLFQTFKGVIAIDSDSDSKVTIISAAYERQIVPHFSIGGDAEMYIITLGSTGAFYFNLAAEGRYYPSANFDKFFVGTTLGFNILTGDNGMDGFMGLITSLKVGYKLKFPTSHSFLKNIYAEPSLAYVLSKTLSGFPTPLGWNGGLRLGLTF